MNLTAATGHVPIGILVLSPHEWSYLFSSVRFQVQNQIFNKASRKAIPLWMSTGPSASKAQNKIIDGKDLLGHLLSPSASAESNLAVCFSPSLFVSSQRGFHCFPWESMT